MLNRHGMGIGYDSLGVRMDLVALYVNTRRYGFVQIYLRPL